MAATMNFFEHQKQAKSRTALLVALYIVAMIATIFAVHSVVAGFAAGAGGEGMSDYREAWLNPQLLLIDSLVLFLVIGGVSIGKIFQLKQGGGDGVALSLGGTRINKGNADFAERRLMNIVEEMAIASGVRIPNVYVLREEPSINAFAAGFTPNSSVVAVTRGALDYLNREELQGVIAHEFSHILHQDTALNLKLIGFLFGLEFMVLIGLFFFRIGPAFLNGERRSSGKENSGASVGLALMAFGVALMLIGLIGQLFSNIIRMAISRQREFLADASAVQFTRNPMGIASALKKIGCPNIGSKIHNSGSAEASHMFFGSVGFSGLFNSHPDLSERIRRIDPSFDGTFPKEVTKLDPMTLQNEDTTSKKPATFADRLPEQLKHLHDISAGHVPGAAGTAAGTILAGSVLPDMAAGFSAAPPSGAPAIEAASPEAVAESLLGEIGQPEVKSLRYAEALLEAIPGYWRSCAAEPLGAEAIVCALFLSEDDQRRQKQWDYFITHAPTALQAKTHQLYGLTAQIPSTMVIPIVELTYPTLKSIGRREYLSFRQLADGMIRAGGGINPFGFMVYAALVRDLDHAFGVSRRNHRYSHMVHALREPFVTLMSHFAYAGSDDIDEVRRAFSLGCSAIGINADLLSAEACTHANLMKSIQILDETTDELRQRFLNAFFRCIAADGYITEREGELIRIVSAYFECPMPSFG